MARHDVEFIKSNPDLERLECDNRQCLQTNALLQTPYSDLFSNFKRLERLQCCMADESTYYSLNQRLFQPILTTLKSLYLGYDKGSARTCLSEPKGAYRKPIRSSGCNGPPTGMSPSREFGRNYIYLVQGLLFQKSGACPTLKKLELKVLCKLDGDFLGRGARETCRTATLGY